MHIEIAAEKLFSFMGFTVTNSLLLTWIVVLSVVLVVQLMARKVSLVPAGLQNTVEVGIESVLDMMEGILHSRAKAIKYLPFIGTLFFMILFSNWFGILPGVGSVGIWHETPAEEGHAPGRSLVPFFRPPAADLNYTLALAIISVLTVNVLGIAALGFRNYAGKFIVNPFKNPIGAFVGALELLGEFSKTVSLSFRLFGNVFAGEVLLIIVSFLAPYVAPVPFLLLEIFVGFIQALVFATLSLVFLSIATEEHS